ncbi:hypothetical protein [Staphylococcus simulans]|uniref:hypothetical protein n=1 Tax=Staphylococcus simulans TaxID=1286 RepID=UPI000F6CA7A9|nr:hypothetical protein [Staphylococcus simulans]VED60425.1 Uncharacterised protein [Staphylococcus simulans]
MLSLILNIMAVIASIIVLVLVVKMMDENQRLRRKVLKNDLELMNIKSALSKLQKDLYGEKKLDPVPWIKKSQGIYKDYAQDYQDEVSDKNEKN